MVWTLALYWYQIYDNFDCAYLFEYTYVLLFNLAFSSLPIIFMGILDQDVSDKISLAVPQLYRRGIERKEWTQPKFWAYMFDGAYQSLICYYMTHLLFQPASSVTGNGLDLNERTRYGIYIATSAVIVVNTYVLLNTYRWDWLMVLLVVISILLIYFWTGVYSAFTSSDVWYNAAPQVLGTLSYWVTVLLTVIICLLPRFAIKSFQKVFLPYDIDIIREQARQGKFKYLEDLPPDAPAGRLAAENLVDGSKTDGSANGKDHQFVDEDMRPIYAPSVAPTLQTTTTNNQHSANGSIDSVAAAPRISEEGPLSPRSAMTGTHSRPVSFQKPLSRPLSMDRPRPSFDRVRNSMDIVRPSFEASNDFTSASRLMRLDSRQSDIPSPRLAKGPSNLR